MDDSKTNGLMCLLGTTATKPCFQLLYWRESHIWRCQARSSPERGGPLDFLPLKVSTARWTQNQGFRAEDLVDDTRNLCNTVVSLCSDKRDGFPHRWTEMTVCFIFLGTVKHSTRRCFVHAHAKGCIHPNVHACT